MRQMISAFATTPAKVFSRPLASKAAIGPEPTFGASANKIGVRPCLWASEATPILFLEFFNAVLLIAVYLAVKGATLVEVEMGYGDDNRIMGVLTVEVEAA